MLQGMVEKYTTHTVPLWQNMSRPDTCSSQFKQQVSKPQLPIQRISYFSLFVDKATRYSWCYHMLLHAQVLSDYFRNRRLIFSICSIKIQRNKNLQFLLGCAVLSRRDCANRKSLNYCQVIPLSVTAPSCKHSACQPDVTFVLTLFLLVWPIFTES